MSLYRPRAGVPLGRLLSLAAVGIAIGLAGMLIVALPRIERVSPEGASASLAPVAVTFSAVMDQPSVESRLSIEPPHVGAFHWQGNTVEFTPADGWHSTEVRVSLAAGARSARGLPLLFGRSWQFSIGEARIAFLLRQADIANVFTIPASGGEPQPLTAESHGVGSFAVSPDGTFVIFSANRLDGGADLRRISRDGGQLTDVLLCPLSHCAAPAISPDGSLVAFERAPMHPIDPNSTALVAGNPTIEVLALSDLTLFSPMPAPGNVARSAVFLPDGRLSYLDATLQAIAIYDFISAVTSYVPSTSGETGSWSPDGQYLLYPEIYFVPEPTPAPNATDIGDHVERFYSHLLQVEIATNRAIDLSGIGLVEDASPAYSPSGSWIAFGRKSLNETEWTPGRQLWVMRADGTQARRLTDDPFYNHSAFVWTPDESSIIFMRFNVTDPSSPAELWAIEADGSNARQLVGGGYLPEWMP